MATNDFKPFAIAPSANVTNQADYAALPAVLSGFTAGVASSAQINKALRQSTVLASVLAQFISNQLSADVLDDGDTTTLLNNLIAALNSNGAASFLQKANNFSEIKAAGAVSQAAALANLGSSDGTLKGRLLNVQVFVSSAIYSATPGTTNVIVEVQAAGGPGGGAAATGAGAVSMGTGGTAGAYGKGHYTSGFNGVSVIIGAGGVPLAGGTGTAGGNSSFGLLLSCPGGAPGTRRGPTAPPFSVTGAPTGSLPTGANIQASSGSPGGISFAVSTLLVAPGLGGSSQLGGGGSLNGVGINGNNGISPGSAGSGAANTENSAAVLAGGYGANGQITVWEYA